MSLIVLPSHWLGWSFGGGLSFVFLWMISVRPLRDHIDEITMDR